MEGQKCKIENRDYDNGVQICDEKLCYVCADGIWESKGTLDFIVRSL